MNQLTKEDLLKLAELLKVEHGIEIMVMLSPMQKKGVAILLMNADDMEDFKEIFKSIEATPLLPFSPLSNHLL